MQVLTHNETDYGDRECVLDRATHKVAYVMSRFPKLTETFVLFEMQAIERLGVTVEVYPLLRARNSDTHPEGATVIKKLIELTKSPVIDPVMHADARPFVERAHYVPFFGWSIFWAQLWFLVRRPKRYLSMLWSVCWANLGSLNYWLGTVSVFPKCVYFARRMETDGVTHIHAHFANHPAAAAFVIHGLTGIPYSFTAHGSDFQVDQHMLRDKVKAAHHVITISENNKRFLVEHCGEQFRNRIKVVRCGVDTTVFRGKDPRSVAPGKPLQLMSIGTFYEVKGHRYLIDACRRLRGKGIPFQCHLIGVGPLQHELQAQVHSFDLEQHVIFHGRRTRTEIAAHLQDADVFVAPSVPTPEGRREGIPVVLMEAMASEVAVVATRISGIPELIDDEINGLLVPPADPGSLANAIERLQRDDSVRRELGRAGRRKVLEEYDQQANAISWLKLLPEQTKPC